LKEALRERDEARRRLTEIASWVVEVESAIDILRRLATEGEKDGKDS
jgi:hypothetical protein